MLPCFAFASRARPPGVPEISVNRSSYFQSAARPLIRKKAPFPPGTSELTSQASGASLHQKRFRKSRACRGCGWFGLPPAQHIYGYVGVTGNACSCAGLEGAAQNPHKTHALTSPRLALLGSISVSTCASTCRSPHLTRCVWILGKGPSSDAPLALTS